MGTRCNPDLVTKPKCNAILGELPVLQYCPVEQLAVDEGYQRSLATGASIKLIRRIAANWDWGLCQPLYVARRDGGKLFVVDGQHRWAAARLRGDVWQLPCVVRSFADSRQEAAAFVALNQERTPLTQLQIFRAAVASGDPEACGIAAAIEEAGLAPAMTTNNQQCAPGAISNIGGLRTCWRMHGKETLVAALRVLRCAFPGQVLRYAGSIFPGIVALVAPAMKVGDSRLIDKITELVSADTQDRWVSRILQRIADDPSLNRNTAAVIVFKAAQRGEEPPPPRSLPPSAPGAATDLRPAEMAWCAQCDQRVSGAAAAKCASPFCKLKRAA